MSVEILILFIVFQIKHLIADYYLQFPYMYENKGKEKGWFKPLFEHAEVHALGTFMILYFFMFYIHKLMIFTILGLVLFDFITHFVTDRWKATRKTDPSQSWFWKSLGIDQMIHHVVGILIIWYITQGT